MIGAGQNYYESAYDLITGSNRALRQEESRQIELWNANRECLVENKIQRFETDRREVIELVLCPKTTSILVGVVIPPGVTKIKSKWIELKERDNNQVSLFSLYSQSITSGSSYIQEICRWTDERSYNIVRKYSDGLCYLERIYFENGLKVFTRVDCIKTCIK